MVANFVPDQLHAQKMVIPFFDDQSDEKIPGRGTKKTCEQLQQEIRELMLKLEAFSVMFTPGTFDDKPKRYGYRMTFKLAGASGRIEIAALPIRTETPNKKDRALAQALYLVRGWLESEAFSQVYRPGSVPLMPYLLDEKGRTVTEALQANGGIPLLMPTVVNLS